MTALGSYLIEERQKKGMSQRDLKEASGVSTAEISRIESGTRQKPSPIFLKEIAEALRLDYPYLMELAGYVQETREGEKTYEMVFRDADGNIVDVVRGVKEMFRNDATWANVAYRVSRELNTHDREMLTQMATMYLEQQRKAKEEKEGKR